MLKLTITLIAIILLTACSREQLPQEEYIQYTEATTEHTTELTTEAPTEPTTAPPTEPPTEPFVALGPGQIEEALCVTQLMGNNPWLNYTGEITHLPIFANPFFFAHFPDAPVEDNRIADITDQQVAIIHQTLAALGWPTDDIEWEPDLRLLGQTAHIEGYGRLELWGAWRLLSIIFENYPLSHDICFATESQADRTIYYLAERFAHLINMENPVASHYTSYSFNSEYHISHTVFDYGNNILDAILSYNFGKVWFIGTLDETPDPSLWIVQIDLQGLSLEEPLGYKPIITPEEARELLLQGFRTSTITDMHWPGDERALVAPVELVYRTGQFYETFMPYYLFRIEIPEYISGWSPADTWPTRLAEQKAFGWWWVPAVQREYLTYPYLRPVMWQ